MLGILGKPYDLQQTVQSMCHATVEVLNKLVEKIYYAQIFRALWDNPAMPNVHKMDKYNLVVLDEMSVIAW